MAKLVVLDFIIFYLLILIQKNNIRFSIINFSDCNNAF